LEAAAPAGSDPETSPGRIISDPGAETTWERVPALKNPVLTCGIEKVSKDLQFSSKIKLVDDNVVYE
jgi:hypothetical protein